MSETNTLQQWEYGSLVIHSQKHGAHTVIFDKEDEPIIRQSTWSLFKPKNRKILYALSIIKGKTVLMHRLLVSTDLHVDHIDGNGLNNKRENLRAATVSQNAMNRKIDSNNTSGFKGVCWDKRNKKWFAQIVHNGASIYGGRFDSKVEAAKKYNELAVRHFGEFAWLNKIPLETENRID